MQNIQRIQAKADCMIYDSGTEYIHIQRIQAKD